MKDTSLYIHIPYCRNKCIYCDFFSGGVIIADWEQLCSAFTSELRVRRHELCVNPDTLYIGGGTPSLMPENVFSRLVDSVNEMTNPSEEWTEFTIEVNPDDVTPEKCKAWKRAGVTRISMGIQSLNDRELKALGRRHSSSEAVKALECLKKYFSNVSVDLMFGIPGQTLKSWGDTVRRVVEMRPEHFSAYSLMLEEGTALTVLCNQGKIALPEEDVCAAMWEHLSSVMKGKGYEQYEISNYSLPGYRSVHNSRYWSGNPYLGLGPSAHSYDGANIRRRNPSDIKSYLKHFSESERAHSFVSNTKSPFYEEEILTEEERIEERILTEIRKREGIDAKAFREDFGEKRMRHLLDNARAIKEEGCLEVTDKSISLTRKGLMVSNRIILDLIM